MQKRSSQSRDIRWKQWWRYYDSSRWALAILHGRRFLADYPDFGKGWLILGTCLMNRNRLDEAEEALRRGLELRSEDKQAYALNLLGELAEKRGDYELAAVHYRRAIEEAPGRASAYIYLGCLLSKQGRLSEAEELFRSATECTEGCISEAFYNLGVNMINRERFEDAIGYFREALRIDPDDRMAKKAVKEVQQCLDYLRAAT